MPLPPITGATPKSTVWYCRGCGLYRPAPDCAVPGHKPEKQIFHVELLNLLVEVIQAVREEK